MLKIDELSFDTSNWGPVLLAIDANQQHILEYFLEVLELNPSLYLIRP